MNYKIALDAMGGDNAPVEIVKGAVASLKENNEITIVLIGKEDIILEELKKYEYDKSRIEIVNATQVIETGEAPINAIRSKKDSSIVVGLKMVKKEEVSAFISSGSTGAVLTGATTIINRIKGVERPSLATLLPNEKERFTLLIDAGANMDCKPQYLLQFAKIGRIYMENILGYENPKVGIVNVGIEREKGDTLTKEAFELLEKEKEELNFVGSIEAREIPQGAVDVVVCDGFVGNVILKLSEGVTKSFTNIIKKEIKSKWLYLLGGFLIKGAMKNVKEKVDHTEIGGAPFLGLKGLVLKAHGSSEFKSIKSAINQCYNFIKKDIVSKIKESISENKEDI